MKNPHRSRIDHLHTDEEGMLSLVSLFVVLGFLILFSLVSNVGKTVTQKLETQNAADSVAYSAGVEMARGMNSITAANHLMGELTALVVLHHAFGGDELDNGRRPRRTGDEVESQTAMTTAYQQARSLSQVAGLEPPQGYDAVRQRPQVGAAIYDARVRLKQVMTWAYVTHAFGAAIKTLGYVPVPGVAQALQVYGTSIVLAAIVFEGKVLQEWQTLTALELFAKSSAPAKQGIRGGLIPGINTFTLFIQTGIPLKAENAAAQVAGDNAAEGSLFPGLRKNPSVPVLQLPVTPEPTRVRDPKLSQLIRASSPWIQYWRIPVFRFAEQTLLLSRFKHFYENRTDEYTLSIIRQLKQSGVNPLILKDLDLDGRGKTFERWTYADGSPRVDELFCTIGFAHRPAPKINSFGIFRQGNPDGFAAYSQTMIYNANPQQRGSATAALQPVAGWDTLNWDPARRVLEYPGPSLSGEEGTINDVPEPRIHLNWQTKLVPTTRLPESIIWQRGSLGEIMRRTIALSSLSSTH